MWRLHTCLIFTECVWHMMLFDNKPIHSHFRHVKHLAAFSQEGTVNLDTTVSCWKSLTSSKNSQQHRVRRRPYVTCMCKRPCCLNLQVQLFCWQKKANSKIQHAMDDCPTACPVLICLGSFTWLVSAAAPSESFTEAIVGGIRLSSSCLWPVSRSHSWNFISTNSWNCCFCSLERQRT